MMNTLHTLDEATKRQKMADHQSTGIRMVCSEDPWDAIDSGRKRSLSSSFHTEELTTEATVFTQILRSFVQVKRLFQESAQEFHMQLDTSSHAKP